MAKKLSLDRILQSQGFGSRKGCRELIEEGAVAVNGEIITQWRSEFTLHGLVFTVFDEEWLYREQVYIVLNKPFDYECSRKPSSHPGVLTLLPENFEWRDVQPVGRLDHDTTGLLLLSDDGAFIHAQSSPKRHQPKIYVATTAEPITDKLVAELIAGVKLHDEPAPIAALSCRKPGRRHRRESSRACAADCPSRRGCSPAAAPPAGLSQAPAQPHAHRNE